MLSEIDYGYDVFGDMISRVVSVSGSSTTHFAYDVSNASPGINDSVNPLYAELSSGGTITERYLRDANGNIAARTGSDTDGVAWLITDYQGSVRDILTAAGTWEGTVSYDGFGNITSETGAALTGNYAFQGMYLDRALTLGAGNGTNEAVYRFELPDGQWTAQDQTGLGPDVNDRREMGNDGTNVVDPSGLAPVKEKPPPIQGDYSSYMVGPSYLWNGTVVLTSAYHESAEDKLWNKHRASAHSRQAW